MENRCVTCGAVIPEGLQVCHACERMAYERMFTVRGMDKDETLDKLRRICAIACGLSSCTRILGMPRNSFIALISNAIQHIEKA